MANAATRQAKKSSPKHNLRLADLDQARSAVLNSLPSKESQRGYRHAIDEFIAWYCSEPRLSFNKAVVTLGNWLTADQAKALWLVPDPDTLKGKRDRALLRILLGCGLRRKEAAELDVANLQQREDHWAIVDMVGKARHIRTVPVPNWVKTAIDSWLGAASVSEGRVFRCVCRAGKIWGDGITERVVWHVVKNCAKRAAIAAMPAANSTRSNFCWATCPFRRPRNTCDPQIPLTRQIKKARSTFAPRAISSNLTSAHCGRAHISSSTLTEVVKVLSPMVNRTI